MVKYPNTIKGIISKLGQKVRIGHIDEYGMLGRELHPPLRGMNRKTGRIVGLDVVVTGQSNIIASGSDISGSNIKLDLISGEDYYSYLVKFPGGKIYQILFYEIDEFLGE